MADLEQRMDALEGQMTQLREEWRVVAQAPLIQSRLLNALRETQVEHGSLLAGHGARLDRIEGTLAEHSRVLAEQSRVLAEQSRVLAEHGRVLAEHGGMLAEHTRLLTLQGEGQRTIVSMLTTLIERGD